MHLVFYQIIYRFFLVSRNLTIFFSIYLNVFLWERQGGGGVITKLDYFWVDFYKSQCQNSSKFLSVSYLMKTADVIMNFFSSHNTTDHT